MPHRFARPSELTLSVTREEVEATCPACGGQDVARYPVVAELGWLMVTKCQSCLHSLEREPWGRFGSISHLSEGL